MKELVFSGKNIDDAKRAALKQLGVSEDKVIFTVLRKGKSGILGMRSEEAQVSAAISEIAERVDQGNPQSQKENYLRKETSDEAQKVLEALINLLGLKAVVKNISSADDSSPVTLNLEGDDLGVLIGRRGQTLASLQYLVRLILSEKSKTWVSINIDVAGYKQKRYESLEKLALRLADHISTTKRSMNMEPMPPDERRIIHLTLANHPEVTTHSIDEGEQRKVVIQYRKR